ncbi:SigE family RNA polymerase sigma factor [Plantactinospora sp. S1510]|uniref:SigE family RNA polymerase sigma factor n=1 Tax=Plantactinospora alkalitolerans TaxID=2789879 RepID=A0ABS0GXP1_9ACTN|nr:SigE family RNA polymerase sigma factor [Plantactinospora alkalitolerans]MBF9130748.1 SigE family RNA polymerase sigma factor [Plantactinospora alkalitolerans]
MGLHLFRSADDRDKEFADYYAARGARMRTTAFLLCGDWYLAEDLTQIAFTKLYRAWRGIDRHEVLDQYVRRILLRVFLDEKRRPWRREHSSGHESAQLDRPVAAPDIESRLVLRAALAALPPRQRAVLVLRFWEDLSIEQAAEVLGVPGGTVKSQTARGLERLRALVGRDITGESPDIAGGNRSTSGNQFLGEMR